MYLNYDLTTFAHNYSLLKSFVGLHSFVDKAYTNEDLKIGSQDLNYENDHCN